MSITVPLQGFGGAGTSLNFDIKAYETEADVLAATPKENTIGVVTSTPISSWTLSAIQPESIEDGMLWIKLGSSSDVEFNALKKNAIVICPLSASQYINGGWVDVEAMSYKSGSWINWLTYILNKDNLYNGWTKTGGLTAAVTSDGVLITVNDSYGTYYYNDKFDVSKFSSLNVEFSDNTTTLQLLAGTKVPASGVTSEVNVSSYDTNGILSADLSTLKSYSSVYIGLGPYNRAGGSILIKRVWLK